MCSKLILIAGFAAGLLGSAATAWAEDGNWKVGRVYYRMVCTECHQKQGGQAISPSGRTKAEWKAYLDADAHDVSKRSNSKVSYYASAEFREGAKGSNKAAEKFLSMPADKLMADIRAFVEHGAKDSDTPESCQ